MGAASSALISAAFLVARLAGAFLVLAAFLAGAFFVDVDFLAMVLAALGAAVAFLVAFLAVGFVDFAAAVFLATGAFLGVVAFLAAAGFFAGLEAGLAAVAVDVRGAALCTGALVCLGALLAGDAVLLVAFAVLAAALVAVGFLAADFFVAVVLAGAVALGFAAACACRPLLPHPSGTMPVPEQSMACKRHWCSCRHAALHLTTRSHSTAQYVPWERPWPCGQRWLKQRTPSWGPSWCAGR